MADLGPFPGRWLCRSAKLFGGSSGGSPTAKPDAERTTVELSPVGGSVRMAKTSGPRTVSGRGSEAATGESPANAVYALWQQ